METLLRLSRRATYADYRAVEQNSDHRHEFIDGVKRSDFQALASLQAYVLVALPAPRAAGCERRAARRAAA
jgi:hypothetical protein